MKNKKILFYYFLEFLLTILVFFFIILVVLKITLFNKEYLKYKLVENNYYHNLYEDINDEFDNYIMQSGFDRTIVNNLFTVKDLEKVINNNVDNFYDGKEIIVDTSDLEDKININISNYLENHNLKIIDTESIDLFKKEIVNIYRDRIILNDKFIQLSNIFYNIKKTLNLVINIILIISLFLFLMLKFLFKKITLTIPFLASSMLLALGYFLIIKQINIQYIIFWNDYVSNILKSIFYDIEKNTRYFIIFCIGFEVIKLLIIYVKKSRKN